MRILSNQVRYEYPTILSLSIEQTYWHNGVYRIAGVDEVGRGCIAGPVVAAAVVFDRNHMPLPGVNDSKQLTEKQREALAPLLNKQAIFVGIGVSGPHVIDVHGIVTATSSAMAEACSTFSPDLICVDGLSDMNLHTRCHRVVPMVKGDQRMYSIAAASIIAKVYRDALMKSLSSHYPVYGWESNKGYGTKLHYESIRTYGLSPLHRISFIRL